MLCEIALPRCCFAALLQRCEIALLRCRIARLREAWLAHGGDDRVVLQEHKLADRRDREASQDNNENDTIPDNDEDARQRMGHKTKQRQGRKTTKGTQDQTTTRTQDNDINNSNLVFAVQDNSNLVFAITLDQRMAQS